MQSLRAHPVQENVRWETQMPREQSPWQFHRKFNQQNLGMPKFSPCS